MRWMGVGLAKFLELELPTINSHGTPAYQLPLKKVVWIGGLGFEPLVLEGIPSSSRCFEAQPMDVLHDEGLLRA